MNFKPPSYQRRRILPLGIETPLLVPSFSSKGFPHIELLVKELTRQTADVSLISAYDLRHTKIARALQLPNLLFIDSGGYEVSGDYDLSEVYRGSFTPRAWDQNELTSTLQNLLPTLNGMPYVLISFDGIGPTARLGAQICAAEYLFSEFSDATSDFLIKPFDSRYICVDEIRPHVAKLGAFDIVGVTEKELGATLSLRVGTLTALRRLFDEANIVVPIHVFGCLDPLSIWLYFLAGADIFDGLSWLRYAFVGGAGVYHNSWAIQEVQTELTPIDLQLIAATHNLRQLRTQRVAMIHLVEQGDLTVLPPEVMEIGKRIGFYQ